MDECIEWSYKRGNINILHLNDFVFAAGHFCSCRWVLLCSHSVLACPFSSSTNTCRTYIAYTHRKGAHKHTPQCTQWNSRTCINWFFALLLIKNNERTCAEQSYLQNCLRWHRCSISQNNVLNQTPGSMHTQFLFLFLLQIHSHDCLKGEIILRKSLTYSYCSFRYLEI